MAGSLPVRKPALAGPQLPRRREISDLLQGRSDGPAAVDASYGDTLRKLMPRRLAALLRARRRAAS